MPPGSYPSRLSIRKVLLVVQRFAIVHLPGRSTSGNTGRGGPAPRSVHQVFWQVVRQQTGGSVHVDRNAPYLCAESVISSPMQKGQGGLLQPLAQPLPV